MESTARWASGTTTPAGSAASVKVTRPRVMVGAGSAASPFRAEARAASSSMLRAFRRSACLICSLETTRPPPRAPAFSGADASDSSNGIDSSVSESSSDSRAPRSGAANTQANRLLTISLRRPMNRVSDPAIAGCSILSSAVTAPPARMRLT